VSHLIGVDGGGTGCRAAVAETSGNVLARAQGGPANIATDIEMARENIMTAIQSAWGAAELDQKTLHEATCVLGLAGANVGEFGKQLKDSLPFENCMVTDDRESSLQGALGDEDGCIAVVGTGSFYSGRHKGIEKHIGGWGFLVGDDGSSARIGQDLLRRVIHCYDGLHQHSELTRNTLMDFNDSPQAIVEFAMQARPNDFGNFTPAVVEAAHLGDTHGLAIVNAAVKSIQACIDQVGFLPDSRLCLLGGLGPNLIEFMHPVYANANTEPKGNALSGALAMAQHLAINNQA